MARGRRSKQYALYKGDEFLELGYLKDIAQKTGVNLVYLYTMTGKQRNGNYTLDLLEDE